MTPPDRPPTDDFPEPQLTSESGGSSPTSHDAAGQLETYREAVKNYELASTNLASLRSSRRAYLILAITGLVLAAILAYSIVVGLWNTQPVITRYVGVVATAIIAFVGGRLFWKSRPELTKADLEVRNTAYDKQTAAAKLPLVSNEALRIYRESSLDLVDHFRDRATRNRRVHNAIQAIIIVASILASTAMALSGDFGFLRWLAIGLSTIVSISAGLAAYFKFRERGHGLQTTADEIDKHYTAAQFQIDSYEKIEDEKDRLLQFARHVEKLKEEQRKRELQLEQSPERTEERGG